MYKRIVALSTILCSLAATASAAELKQYVFTWKNMSPTTQCSPLEIKVLNNGSVVDQKYSGTLLLYQVPVQMTLNATYCTKIQLKALCSGSNNFQEIGCTGGTIEITSPNGMTFYR
jgi:hypothetical protein